MSSWAVLEGPVSSVVGVPENSPLGLIDRFRSLMSHYLRSEKLHNESSPNFSNFCPGFCPEFCSKFSPNFSRMFHASFRWKRRPEKILQKSPPLFNAKFPGKYEKNIHKMFLEGRQSNISSECPNGSLSLLKIPWKTARSGKAHHLC